MTLVWTVNHAKLHKQSPRIKIWCCKVPPFSLYANETKRYRYNFTTVQKQQQQQQKLCKEATTLYLCSQQICAVIAVWEIHANQCRSSYNDTIVLCLDQRSYVVVSQKLTSHAPKSMSTFLFTISHSCLELHPTSPSELIQEESGDFWLTERIAGSPLHLSLSADCLSDYLQPEKNTCAPFEVRAQVQ